MVENVYGDAHITFDDYNLHVFTSRIVDFEINIAIKSWNVFTLLTFFSGMLFTHLEIYWTFYKINRSTANLNPRPAKRLLETLDAIVYTGFFFFWGEEDLQ